MSEYDFDKLQIEDGDVIFVYDPEVQMALAEAGRNHPKDAWIICVPGAERPPFTQLHEEQGRELYENLKVLYGDKAKSKIILP